MSKPYREGSGWAVRIRGGHIDLPVFQTCPEAERVHRIGRAMSLVTLDRLAGREQRGISIDEAA